MATLGPFTATKFLVTATFTATFWAEIHLKAENIYLYWLILSLKGQSNEIFDPQFFSPFVPAWTNGLKWFRFWFCFHWDIHIFTKFRAVSYCAESSSAQYDTAQSQWPLFKTCAQAFKGTVSVSTMKFVFDSAQYYTARSQIFFTQKYEYLGEKGNQNRNYFNPMVSGPDQFEWWKNWRSKISLDCLFKLAVLMVENLVTLSP